MRPPRPKRPPTKRWASPSSSPSCARATARSRRPRGASCRVSWPAKTCRAPCTATRTPPTAATRSSRWRARPTRCGLRYLTVTDHSPAAHYANGLSPERLRRQWDEIARVQEQRHRPAPARNGVRHPRGRRARLPARGASSSSTSSSPASTSATGMDRAGMTQRIVTAHAPAVVQDLGPRARALRAAPAAHRLRPGRGAGRDRRLARGHRDQRRPAPARPRAALAPRGAPARHPVRGVLRRALDPLAPQPALRVDMARRAGLTRDGRPQHAGRSMPSGPRCVRLR